MDEQQLELTTRLEELLAAREQVAQSGDEQMIGQVQQGIAEIAGQMKQLGIEDPEAALMDMQTMRAEEQIQQRRQQELSQANQLGAQQGMQVGMQQGMQRGAQQGMQAGMEQGYQKGYAAGNPTRAASDRLVASLSAPQGGQQQG